MTRREVLAAMAAPLLNAQGRTNFQIACMTLPYSGFPFERALKGIRNAGYKYVAWGTSHQRTPIVAVDAPAAEARAVGRKTRDAGLEPVMMFSTVHIEAESAVAVHIRRIKQAAAAGIPFVLTFGKTTPGEYPKFIQNLKGMTSAARDNNVMVLIKQHGGNTATGKDCARVVADVGEERVRICYDAGNVLDYENQDPIPDIRECWRDVRAFAIKDHRNFPKDQDCGPGLGEIDHYKLLAPVINTGLSMPLACENIFEPIVPRPKTAEGIDALAQRAREFLETVIRGLNAAQA